MKSLLFITATRLGDAVLSTGVLQAALDRYAGAAVTIACGPIPASLFEGVPGLERLLILRKKPWGGHWVDLWRAVAGHSWDAVIDLRHSVIPYLIAARARHRPQPTAKGARRHVVIDNASALDRANTPPAPRLWPTEDQMQRALALIPRTSPPVLGVGPTANWLAKTWPSRNFIALTQRLIADDGPCAGWHVAVFAAPGEEAMAQTVLDTLPAARRYDVIARADAGTAAAALTRCAFYVGNDSGLMHCAAAAGIPTVGLFGPSYPERYAPWGPHGSTVQTPKTFDELIAYPGYTPRTAPCLMEGLSVDRVFDHIAHTLKNV